ncbi:HypC/HybG/HupF family hydrogenase formation chaperone [Actinoplanes sp. NPDC049599]|uniref:HypC/HybG/HupF family hydrogenase formation chaperone n=1 Tax=Actinoplanes sp. NPDC049599 TaxID=3363903 RepID=UPI0037911961
MCLGIPGRITRTTDVAGMLMGTADFGGVSREVCLAYVPQARVGDYVIVHVGFAISLVDEAEAQRTLEVLRAMGDALQQELSPEDANRPAPPNRTPA